MATGKLFLLFITLLFNSNIIVRATIKKNTSTGSQNSAFFVHNCAKTAELQKKDAFGIRSKGSPHKWPLDGFCLAYKLGKKHANYTAKVDVQNMVGNRNKNFGHPGIMINVQNCMNYDFIYFRPHSAGGCYQRGYVENNMIRLEKSGSCQTGTAPLRDGKWFQVRVIMTGGVATLGINGRNIMQWSPHFEGNGQVGFLIANGYDNFVRFKDLGVEPLCPGVDDVIETEPPGSYPNA